MNENSQVITTLCSLLCINEDIDPLKPKEWEEMAKRLVKKKLEPKDLLKLAPDEIENILGYSENDVQRILRLIDRSGSLAFEIEKYENIGIKIVTRADNNYPKILKKKLLSKCPPLFYFAGDLDICNLKSIGFVGSRNVDDEQIDVTKNFVEKMVSQGYAIVSGGAKGIDQISINAALSCGGKIILYVADSMIKKMKDPELIKAIHDKNAVIISVVKPDAGFNTGIAMMRNKYIYAQSEATIAIKSDYKKGGTWSGAVDNLKNRWCIGYCFNDSKQKGNQELIKLGAIPVRSDWDGDINTNLNNRKDNTTSTQQQLSLFDQL